MMTAPAHSADAMLHAPLESDENLVPLTSIRFYFAFIVVLFHLIGFMNGIGFDTWPPLIHGIIYSGFLGVNFFFVLSGFILTHAYHGRLDAPGSIRSFWLARFARIYPGYCIGFLLLLPMALYALMIAPDRGALLADAPAIALLDALLVQSWIPAAAIAWNGPSWSLSTEAFFYAVFPLAARRFDRMGVIAILLTALAIYCLSIGIGFYFALDPFSIANAIGRATHLEPAYIETIDIFYMYFPPARLPEFLFGCLGGVLFIRHRAWLRRWRWLCLAAGLAGVTAAVDGLSGLLPMSVWSNGLLMPFVMLVLWGLAESRSTILTHRLSRMLGEASFSLYIIHIPVWMLMTKADLHLFQWQRYSPWPFVLLYLAACIALSLLFLTLVETPLRRIIRNWGKTPVTSQLAMQPGV